jgi:hypothetical protein
MPAIYSDSGFLYPSQKNTLLRFTSSLRQFLRLMPLMPSDGLSLFYVCRAPTSHLSSLESDGNPSPERLLSVTIHSLSASLPPTLMSLLVEGSLVSSLGFAPTSRTVLSRSFYDSLQRPAVRLLFTTTVVPYGTCSTVLHCDVSPTANFDVVLGHDWAFLFRDYLISIGHRLSTSFDPWQLFLTASVNSMTSLYYIYFFSWGPDFKSVARTEPLGGFIGTKSASVFPRLNRLLAPALPVSQPIQSIPASTVPPALKRSRGKCFCYRACFLLTNISTVVDLYSAYSETLSHFAF